VIDRRSFVAACLTAPLLRARLAAQQAVGGSLPPDPQTMDDLVAANRILANQEVLDAWGHVSVRHPRRVDRFLLARAVAPSLVTVPDIMEYDLESRPIDARGRASAPERFIHSELYRARPDVRAVVHCHTASLVPFSISPRATLRPVFHMSAFIAEGIPVFDIRAAVGLTDMQVKDQVSARALARTLATSPAALLRGHGAVVVGASLPIAVGRAIYLDLNARMQVQAIALGGQPVYLDPEEARLASVPTQYDSGWELWKQQVTQAR
jgi:HCOMODA/2-hydroxy-3-carboxy-muconic semialdehyde decarboxylase